MLSKLKILEYRIIELLIIMEKTALSFTDFASYCFINIRLYQNSLTFAYFSNFPDQFQNSLIFPTLKKNHFSLTFPWPWEPCISSWIFNISAQWVSRKFLSNGKPHQKLRGMELWIMFWYFLYTCKGKDCSLRFHRVTAYCVPSYPPSLNTTYQKRGVTLQYDWHHSGVK